MEGGESVAVCGADGLEDVGTNQRTALGRLELRAAPRCEGLRRHQTCRRGADEGCNRESRGLYYSHIWQRISRHSKTRDYKIKLKGVGTSDTIIRNKEITRGSKKAGCFCASFSISIRTRLFSFLVLLEKLHYF